MPRHLRTIYGYRSKALHEGTPFPYPMCEVPFQHEDWAAHAETPLGLATTVGDTTWAREATPMLLHTFEYIARGVLQNWWKERGQAGP